MNPYIIKLLRKNLIISGAILFILLLIEYVIVGLHFRTHFYANTFIAGVDCSNLTVEEADKVIRQKVSGYSLAITGNNNLVQKISAEDIFLSYQYQRATKELLKSQKCYIWAFKAFGSHQLENPSEIVYNKDQLNKLLDNICSPKKGKLIKSENAKLSSYNKNSGFSIIKEVVGNELDRSLVHQVVERSIHTLSTEVSLEKEGCYIKPTVISTSPTLQKALETIKVYLKTKLTYQFGTHTEVLDQTQIGPAIVVDANNKVTLDEKKLSGFVTYLATTYNNAEGYWKFQTSYHSVANIKGQSFAYIIDEKQELQQIIEAIKEGKQCNKEAAPASNSPNKKYQTIGNTYVEINKTKQHLFYYKQGKLILETDVVTGILRNGHDTPVGLYHVTQKQQNRTLRGFNDDGSKYAALVRYWMRFNGSIGLHDAPWQPYFGGNRYRYAGSHGCVNMPTSAARKLYKYIDLYTPVIVY